MRRKRNRRKRRRKRRKALQQHHILKTESSLQLGFPTQNSSPITLQSTSENATNSVETRITFKLFLKVTIMNTLIFLNKIKLGYFLKCVIQQEPMNLASNFKLFFFSKIFLKIYSYIAVS